MKNRSGYFAVILLFVISSFFLVTCGGDGGVYDTVPPTVSSTSPSDSETDVAVNADIIVTFSEAMNASTIAPSTFSITDGATYVPCTVIYSGTTATIKPLDPLSYDTTYTATITTGVRDLAGNTMAEDYAWSFSTVTAPDVTPPTVSSIALVDLTVVATFSEEVDTSTVTTSTFTVSAGTAGTTNVSGTVTSDGTTATFTPSETLTDWTDYTATITTGVRDLAGNPMASDYTWYFETYDNTPPTVASTVPADNETHVVATAITVTFSEDVLDSSVTTSTFTVSDGTANISGSVWSGGGIIEAARSFQFLPSEPLLPNTTYTATVTTGVKDRLGNPLAADYTWSFTTATFPKIWGGPCWDFGYSVRQTSDGGYIVVGETVYCDMTSDVYLIKTDPDGNTLWTKTLGVTDSEAGYSVQQTSDGGYIIAGYTSHPGVEKNDVHLIKTDSDGNTLWTKTFGGTGYDSGYSVQQTSDGGYIIAGYTESFGAGQRDVYLIKTDPDGNTLWTKTFGGTDDDFGYSVQQTSDGGYIIAGYTESFGAGLRDVYLIKTDKDGNTLWTKTFGGTGNDNGKSVQQTSDGGYIMTGDTESFGAGLTDVYLIKTDQDGNTLWTKTFGGSREDGGTSVQQTSDGGYIVTGKIGLSWDDGSDDIYLIKTGSDGNTLWTKTIGGWYGDTGNSVQQTSDGGYIITGETWSWHAESDFNNVILIKTDSNGIVQ